MPYSDTKKTNEAKVPLSTATDLRDLYNALRVVEKISNLPIRGSSKSKAIDSVIKSLAALGYSQDLIEDQETPDTVKEAREKLAQHFSLSFDNERQERIIAETTSSELDLSQESQKAQAKEEVMEMEKSGSGDSSSSDVEEFSPLEELLLEGSDNLAALVNIAESEGFGEEEIVDKLKPLVGSPLTAEKLQELRDFFQETEPSSQ